MKSILKKFIILFLTAISAMSTFALLGCGSKESTSYDKDGVHYEVEYKFNNIDERISLSGKSFICHNGINTLTLTKTLNKENFTVKASPDFAKNAGTDWKTLNDKFGLSRVRVYYFDLYIHSVTLNENMPKGDYRIELIIPGMQCVKNTYGYIDGNLVSETSEIVGQFAPLENGNGTLIGVGYDTTTPIGNRNVIWYERINVTDISQTILKEDLSFAAKKTPIFPTLP